MNRGVLLLSTRFPPTLRAGKHRPTHQLPLRYAHYPGCLRDVAESGRGARFGAEVVQPPIRDELLKSLRSQACPAPRRAGLFGRQSCPFFLLVRKIPGRRHWPAFLPWGHHLQRPRASPLIRVQHHCRPSMAKSNMLQLVSQYEQKLSIRSYRMESPTTGAASFSQKQTPSILVDGNDSTMTKRMPHSARIRGTLRAPPVQP